MPASLGVLSLIALLPRNCVTGKLLQAGPSSIWDGLDVTDDNLLSALLMTNSINVRAESKTGIQVMGLQDTGTNLMSTLMERNFGNQISHWDSSHGDATHGLWKHANPEALVEQVPDELVPLSQGNVSIIAMIRDPLSWLESLHKAPYELASCVAGDDWLNRSCTHPVPCGYKNEGKAQTYENLLSLWARWTSSYGRLMELGIKEVLVIRYEDLVLFPDQVLTEIASTLKLSMPATIRLMDSPAKLHGEALGHEDAMLKITEQRQLADFAGDPLKMLCDQLKTFEAVLETYSYTDCREA
mmetsp:Transcript_48180/g.104917  ORF Transcript_48180/g.104917 Transcript_48180/m.104917 type:complete len:299 (-) Transcript_48180:89-985(-)|eukprot:CAMPEP_0170579862 /NCGR_PEP_ID=MMETSP0224-20130122/6203_1 /TAXON_ID=285029 /ORGANISM="Togula jolla, Strain CCCM 725" /LENGTH=298 /DNA_ID=CAMNT_0010902901 /DNA_START=60 /DNA_END=956 /DNA_ORIENTATION=+